MIVMERVLKDCFQFDGLVEEKLKIDILTAMGGIGNRDN